MIKDYFSTLPDRIKMFLLFPLAGILGPFIAALSTNKFFRYLPKL